ncbi:DUF2200 family protein [Staphylococcus nepalensis]
MRGVVCRVSVELMENSIMKAIRRLNTMIDELTKGKTLTKLFRVNE